MINNFDIFVKRKNYNLFFIPAASVMLMVSINMVRNLARPNTNDHLL